MGPDQQRAETAGQPGEQDSFERLFDLSLDMLSVAGADGYFRKLNRAWERVLGWRREDLLAKPYLEFVHPEDRERTLAVHRQLVEGRDNVQFENRYLCKNGSYRWLAWTCPGVRPGNDMLYSIARDITEQKFSQEALALVAKTTGFRGDNFFLTVVQHLAKSLQVKWAMVGEFLGRPADRVKMLSFWTGTGHGECFEYALAGTPCAKVAGRQICLYARDVQKSFPEDKPLKELGVESYMGLPLLDRSGYPLGLLVVMDDKPMPDEFSKRAILEIFAQRAGLELERQKSEEKLYAESCFREMVIDHAGQGICVCQQIPDHPFVRFSIWNQRMREITGYTMEEINRRGWYQTVHPDEETQQRSVERMRRMKAGEELNGEEWEIVRSDGSKRQLLITTRIISQPGEAARALAVMQDITERKAAERKANESEAILRAAFDHVPFDFWIMDQQGRHVLQNAVSLKFWGELAKRPPEEWPVTEEVRQKWLENNERALRGEVVLGEVHYEHQGKVNWFYNILAPIWVEGQQQGYLGVNIDISDQKLSEAAMRTSERRLLAFVDNSPALIFIKDLEGRYLLVNSKFAAAFGVKREDIQGRLDRDFSTPEDFEKYRSHDLLILEHGQPLDCEEWASLPDGPHCYMVSKFPLTDARGNITGICGIATDVTDRRKVEDALRESERRYRQLVETARDLIFTLSPEGMVLSLNNALTQATGWVVEDWLGRHYSETLPEEVKAEAALQFQLAMTGERMPLFELPLKTKDGGQITMEVTITPLIEGEKVVGLFGVGRDVTDRKRMEGELRQLQKMESVGQLAAGVAHDFNNILTVIQGNTSLLLANHPEPGQQDLLDQVLDASQRAANLTRQLLAFSRKQVLQRRLLNLNEVTSQMTQMLDRILGEDITLEFHYDTDLPSVKADSSMVEQVILNLAVNARDAMPKGGLLCISTEAVTIDAAYRRQKPQATPGAYVCLSVRDTGCGIAPENLSLIFEPFFTTKEFGKGTGLGLATVYGIIKQHQGWVEVDSAVGSGTVFRLYLPAVEAPAFTSSRSLPQSTDKKGSETILVVEDDPMVRRMLETLLSMGGYQILSAASGGEALQVWRMNHAKVKLLLTDMVMPGGISGKELAETLRRERADLRVLISSGYSSDLISGGEALPPRTWFLAKPYTPKELMEKVRASLDE
jgi:PAS domain S-box-containing protein